MRSGPNEIGSEKAEVSTRLGLLSLKGKRPLPRSAVCSAANRCRAGAESCAIAQITAKP